MTAMQSLPPQPDSFRKVRARPGVALAGFLVVCYAVAGFGAVFTVSEIPSWYAALAKPAFNPPNALFGPVWTVLYGLMAVAAWLVWRTPGEASALVRSTASASRPRLPARTVALVLFAVQLVLNALWTPVFFRLHLLLPALEIIIALWIAILLTAIRFWRLNRLAALLLLPYLAWVAFATALNYEIYRLN